MKATSVLSLFAVLLLVGFPRPAHAETPDGGTLLGIRGLLRTSSASSLPAGFFSLGTDFQFFKVADLVEKGQDHSRLINTYSIAYTPFRWLEAAIALHVTSDSSSGPGSRSDLQVAVGDPELLVKGGAGLPAGFFLGGLVDVKFPSGAGFFEASGSATSALFAALASWSAGPRVPLWVHLNVGFFLDGSKNLFDDPSRLDADQRYAIQLSSFHRVITRLGVEAVTRYVNPFLELSLEPFVGDGAPGFGDSPNFLSFGLKAWPTSKRGLELLAAVDIGLADVGDGSAGSLPSGKWSYAIPRWNLVFRLAYRFDPFGKPEPGPRVASNGPCEGAPPRAEAPKTGVVRGHLLDEKTRKPIPGGLVAVGGEESSGLAPDPRDGAFATYRIEAGARTLVASAPGYLEKKVEVAVTPGGTVEVEIALAPRTTVAKGTLRGQVRDLRGRALSGATILIPELDQSLPIGSDGTFSIALRPGEYKVMISADGFRSQNKRIRISEGSTVILNVELHR
jgi:OmpA-OmpF porin, OOP family